MITEDYCSYEVAKLLKEKGFDEISYGSYTLSHTLNVEFQEGSADWNKTSLYIAAPTHQMAMKWLREKGILICIYAAYYNNLIDTDSTDFFAEMFNLNNGIEQLGSTPPCDTYEAAVEAALKYSLKNILQ